MNLGDFFLPSYLGSAVVSFQEADVAVGLAVAGAERCKLLWGSLFIKLFFFVTNMGNISEMSS